MQLYKLTPLFILGACMAAPAPTPDVTQTPAKPVAEQVVEPVVEAPLPPPDPARLTGLNPRQVQELIGDPSLVRRDANVQAMLFENGDCVFEVIFYEPSPDAHFEATDTNARTRSGVDVDRGECLMKVLPDGKWLDQQ